MKTYNYSELKAQFDVLKYDWPKFHIIGVRSKENINNRFDDNIYVVDGNMLYRFTATTNPGRHWLLNLMNPKGTAVLKPGQYDDAYQIGLHKGQYKALVQRRPITVYRDTDKDETAEEQGIEDTGLFGVNIHRANPNAISSLIEKWSAGCQVLNNPKEFAKLIELCENSKLKEFTYTLLREF
jgi:hypothetical protein